jgi:hypothetical protein
MTHVTARRLAAPASEWADNPLLPAGGGAELRLASPAVHAVSSPQCAARVAVTLRNSDLVADLRQARAARFASRYEWLALRRRRAQIAARHALGE